MTDAEGGSQSLEAASEPETSTEELPHTIEVPEPPGRRGRARAADPEVKRESRGLSAAAWGWIRRHRLETGTFVATVSLLAAVAVYLSIDPGPGRPDPLSTVGPLPGQDLRTYVETRRRALEDLAGEPGRRVAVVTFTSPLTAAQLEGLPLPAGVDLEDVLVGDPLGYPEAVEGGPQAAGAVERWRQNRLEVLDAQRTGLLEVLAASPSPPPAKEWYLRESGLVDQALTRVRDGTVVLGAMFSGTGDGLLALQSDPSVLLVDVAPPGATPERISFRLATG